MNNQLIRKFKSDAGVPIELSVNKIRQTLNVGTATDVEVMNFMELCYFRKLNPFLREAYLVKFKGYPASNIVSKDVFINRLNSSPNCNGYEYGLIIKDKKTGKKSHNIGTFYEPDIETIVGAFCNIYVKNWQHPIKWSITRSEYDKGTQNWKTMPGVMLTKCVIVAAIRNFIPKETAGMYIEDEMNINYDNNNYNSQTELLHNDNLNFIPEELLTEDNIKSYKTKLNQFPAGVKDATHNYILTKLEVKKIEDVKNAQSNQLLKLVDSLYKNFKAKQEKAEKETTKKETTTKGKKETKKETKKEIKEESKIENAGTDPLTKLENKEEDPLPKLEERIKETPDF
jgi:phage recombination protein Bet